MRLKGLDAILIDEEGKKFEDKATVRQVLRRCCSENFNPQLTGISETWQQKDQIGALAVKLTVARKTVQISSEEIALIKPRLGFLFGPIVVNRIMDVLEERLRAEKKHVLEIDQPEE
jgi:hypothetical protein